MSPRVPVVPTRRLIATAVVARWLLTLLVAAWLVFALALAVLHRWIVPRIDQFRPQLEQQATRVLGVPVRIGSLSADGSSGGLFPAFEMRDVALLDGAGREALTLPRVVVSASPRSLVGLGLEQLYIDSPVLDVRRAPDGRITVAGLDFGREGPDSAAAQDWLFSQPELVIRRGTVRWTDEQRAAPPLALESVDLVLRNRARRHDMRLDATPPADWGERFSVVGRFRQPLFSGRAGQWDTWDGQLFASLPRADLSRLRQYAEVGADVREGLGALRVWADVSRGVIHGGAADVALTEVDVRLAPHLEPLVLSSVSGRIEGQRLAGGFEVSTRDLQFQSGDGLAWPATSVLVRYTEPQGAAPRGELRADRLDLESLSRLAHRLPLGDATHQALTAFAPKGQVTGLQARWSGPVGAPTQYEARGAVTGLAVAAQADAGMPGVRGASVEFEMTQAGGRVRLGIDHGALDLPGVFEERVLPLDHLAGTAEWKFDGQQISVQVNGLQFANADAQGQAQGSWRTSDPATSRSRSRFPGVLDLTGTFARAEGTRVHRYLPAHLPADVRHYVRDAVTQGTASDVKFRVRGDLSEMPFENAAHGDFRIGGRVRDVTFAYLPRSIAPAGSLPWPALTQLSGELVFERAGMDIKGATGRFAGVPGLQLAQADARIPDLSHNSTVLVKGLIKGPLADSLKVVATSPLAELTGQVLTRASATGNADVQLDLTLPIHDIDRSRVAGSVVLAGNDIQFTPDTPMLQRSRGTVAFTEAGFTVTGGQARMLGGDMRIEGGSRTVGGDMQVSLRAQGSVTADGLRQAGELGGLARLAQQARGGASYAATLGFRKGAAELSISSNLQGLALDLPAPLGKSADAALPLRFENTLLATPGATLQDQLVLELGRLASVTYVRDLSAAQPRVLRGAIGVGLAEGESAPMPEDGVAANIQLDRIDVDAWERALSNAAGAPLTQQASGSVAGATSAYLPTRMAVRARELVVEGRAVHNVVVGASREGTTWRANLDATEMNGYLEYRQPQAGAPGGRLHARLARMSIGPAQTTEVEDLLDQQPDSLPALDIVVQDFELRGRKLGRIEIEALNRGGGGATREWRLSKFNVVSPEAIFAATGNWAALGAQETAAARPARAGGAATPRRRTVMNFRLDISNAGDLLARHGMQGVVRRGKGQMEGQVAWLGSPLSPDYPSMNGQFTVNIEDGQFLKADPGIAKLLGVLSLQSLPRRLTLDFRDVFTEGFAFDFFRGDVRVEQGVASTNNLQMKGVNAAVLMEGRTSLAAETQDLRVVVVPEINAGTASLVATAINPAIGLGTFLAQMFLRRPLIQAATQEFHIDGSWTDPRIVRVDRGAAAPPSAGGNPSANTEKEAQR
ncbi:MAG: TIGR02099 family protein [Burkholderiaceae bacterium]|nr:TIGR02099 family protein [Burkholderiaceae bacterium]